MRFCYSLRDEQLGLIRTFADQPDVGFEIRLDAFSKTPDFRKLRAISKKPLLAAFRSKPHMGFANLSSRNAKGWDWRMECMAAGFEYIDVELDEPKLAAKIDAIQASGAKAVLSFHALRESQDLDAAFEKAIATKADIVKLVGTGRATADFAGQRDFYRRAGDRGLICFFMGEEFAATRALAMAYGAPFTFLTPDPSRSVAPGQLTYADAVERYRLPDIHRDRMALYGVIGSPIAHSQSPAFHNPRLKERDPDSLFLAFPAETPGDLASLRETFPELRGLAVTKPMKEAAHAAASGFLDDDSEALGAVNTLILQDGQARGANTDLLAMVELLREAEPEASVRVLGYGGLGKAAVRACLRLGLSVEVCNRTPGRIGALPEGARAIPWKARHDEGPSVIVQATSAGMAPQSDESPLERLPRSTRCLIETIYNPRETELMKLARRQGVDKIVDGLALFERQAEIQNRFFVEALEIAAQ